MGDVVQLVKPDPVGDALARVALTAPDHVVIIAIKDGKFCAIETTEQDGGRVLLWLKQFERAILEEC